ncbi:MAG: lipoyl(octanoyl) transferase LipB [bacterium]
METQVTIFTQPVPYAEGLHLQEQWVMDRQTDKIPDQLILLEHTPVITLGVRAKTDHLLISKETLATRGIEMFETPRGGDVTYHAPGQLILYPIMKLTGADADVHAFVGKLEEIAILTASAFCVNAFRRKGKTGVWTDQGKIAAIGIRFKKWVSSHGMSFNVNPNMSGFEAIVPCGLYGEKVTSLQKILGEKCPTLQEVRAVMMRNFERVMNCTLITPGPGHHR